MHPSYAVINLSNLKYNFLNIRKKINNTKIMAVVKAEAYGHGMVECATFLISLPKAKPDYFAVTYPNEGMQLREAEITQPILVFEPFVEEQVELLFKYDLIATVFNSEHLKILERGYNRYIKEHKKKPKVKVHIKIDTGMNRLGISTKDALKFTELIYKKNIFVIDGIYTHFASADEKNKKFTYLQIERFKEILTNLDSKKIKYGLAHAANSAAILDIPESYFEMVRPGIALYGYYPSTETSESVKLKPVMSLHSYITSVKEIEKGDTVSYGRKFKAEHRTRIASVPVGYADGVNRGLSNKIEILIKGKRYSQIGTIAMDRLMVNIKRDNIKVGDKVVMFGKDKNNYISIWEWCKIIKTIPYEITCGISSRIPRIYKR